MSKRHDFYGVSIPWGRLPNFVTRLHYTMRCQVGSVSTTGLNRMILRSSSSEDADTEQPVRPMNSSTVDV